MTNLSKFFLAGLTVAAIGAFAGSAQATPIITGGSALVSGADADQLESWLGQGAINLENIFTKTTGSTSYNFHAAADGKGPTFTVLEAFKNGNRYVVGGYNPQSWNSSSGYNITPNAADRTGFLFNLGSDTLFPQAIPGISDVGQYQTYNGPNYGPTFGGGHDLYVSDSLTWGYAFAYSYCPVGVTSCYGWNGDLNILGVNSQSYEFDSIGRLEVFTIAAAGPQEPPVGAPAPGALAMLGLGLFGLGGLRRKAQA